MAISTMINPETLANFRIPTELRYRDYLDSYSSRPHYDGRGIIRFIGNNLTIETIETAIHQLRRDNIDIDSVELTNNQFSSLRVNTPMAQLNSYMGIDMSTIFGIRLTIIR